MQATDRLIWFKGRLVRPDDALVPVLSPTAQFGLNVFEGLRGYRSDADADIHIFRLREHLDRLRQSCRLIGIDCPHDDAAITAAIREVLAANSYRCDVAVRVTVFVDGEGSWSTSAPVGMFVAPIAKPRRDPGDTRAVRACISTFERIDDRALPPRVKAGANYINGRYAHLQAQADGYDLPILLDRHGKVSEGAGSCLMMVRGGVLATPPASASVLESITRDTLLTLAAGAGIPAEIRTIDRTELYAADEVFLCGSAAEITPIGQIDRFDLGDGGIGPVARVLLDRYHRAVDGRDAAHRDWLTPVYGA